MDEQNSPQAKNVKQTILIITFGMIMGVVFFAAVTILIGDKKPPQGEPLVSYVMAGMALLCLMASTVVPSLVVRTQEAEKSRDGQQPDYMTYLGIFQTKTIIQFALLEGAAFGNLVAVFIEGTQWSLLIAAALVLVMIILLPLPARIDSWIRHRREMGQFENWNQ